MWAAITRGIGDYVTKNGMGAVVLGLSGGIDSAVTATLAVDALGADKVTAIAMPSDFSSEDSLADAQALACAPPVLAAAPVPPPAPVPVAPTPVPERIEAVSVVFNFDRSDARNIRPFSTVQLEELVRRVQQDGREILAVRLSGHADRLNSTGQDDYNLRLSERRVQTVRDLLVGLGVAADRIETTAAGDSQQVTGCEQRFSSQVDLRECLLPNRRVEVTVRTRAR